MSSKLFLISGHGYEKIIPYESRKTLPAQTYLVTMSECGIPSKLWQLYNTMRAFMDKSNETVLRDPISNKEQIDRLINMEAGTHPANSRIRIYGPGEPYPDIYTDFYAFFRSQGSAGKSGLYTFPLDPLTFILQPEKPEDNVSRIVGDPTVLDPLYRGSIFPPKEMQGDSELRFSIDELIKKFGPGVYYYPICRAQFESPQPFDIKEFREYLEQYTIKDPAIEAAIASAKTPQEMYDAYMRIPEATRNSFERSYMGKIFAPSLRNELKLPNIRAKSAQRQRTRGGKRKTRGRKRTLRKKDFQRRRA